MIKYPNKKYTILLKGIKCKIALPKILGGKKATLSIDEEDTIEDLKYKLIPKREKLENKEFDLYLANKKLSDKTKFTDLLFINKFEIECKLLFNFICTEDSVVKFENFKEFLDENITIYECRKKCLEAIKKNHGNICRNIKRISFRINKTKIKNHTNSKRLLYVFYKLNEYKEIQVTVKKDEIFKRIYKKEKSKTELQDKFYCESNVGEIREKINDGYNFIIMTIPSKTVIFDDMPLFSIPGEICTKDITKEQSKTIKLIFLEKIRIRESLDKKRKLVVKFHSTVEDLKKSINDIYLTGNIGVNDIAIAIKPSKYEEGDDDNDDDFPEGYELTNYKDYRILCDTQRLLTFPQNTVYVIKKETFNDGKPAVSLTYINNETKKEETMKVEYKDTDTVNDLMKILESITDLVNEERVILYMGKVQHPDKKLKDIIVGKNINFYATIIQKPPNPYNIKIDKSFLNDII